MPAQTAPSRSVAFIPPEEVIRLHEIRASRDLDALRARIKALRDAGWTLAGIGAPMEVPYSTVRAWENSVPPNATIPHDDVPTPGRPPRRAGHVIRIRKVRPDVPAYDRPILTRLSEEARVLRRTTPPNHPGWHSQADLETRLGVYLDRGVPTANLARYCKVSNRAIAARMERSASREVPKTPRTDPSASSWRLPAPTPAPAASKSPKSPKSPKSLPETYVTVWKDPASTRGGLLTYADGKEIARRAEDEVSRATNPSPTVLQDTGEDRELLHEWLVAPLGAPIAVKYPYLAVPAPLTRDILGWDDDAGR